MANKNVYQNYNLDALIHFGLDSDPFYGVITSSQVDDVLITQDGTTFKNIRKLFIWAWLMVWVY